MGNIILLLNKGAMISFFHNASKYLNDMVKGAKPRLGAPGNHCGVLKIPYSAGVFRRLAVSGGCEGVFKIPHAKGALRQSPANLWGANKFLLEKRPHNYCTLVSFYKFIVT